MLDFELLVGACAALIGYLAGSVPFAYIFVRRSRGFDLRERGSGNVGAANVLRTTSKTMAGWVVALDVVKGAAAVWTCRWLGLGATCEALAGFAAVVGHVYPVWLGGRGGKGVSTAAGAFLVLSPVATLVAIGVFILGVALTSYVSLGSVSAMAVLAPLTHWLGEPPPLVAAAALTAALVTFRHRSNLGRIQAGTERRLGTNA